LGIQKLRKEAWQRIASGSFFDEKMLSD